MASARDVSDDDVGLPAGLTPTAEGKVKRLVVVGESRDAKSTIINFLRNPEAVTPRATMETSERVGTSIAECDDFITHGITLGTAQRVSRSLARVTDDPSLTLFWNCGRTL